MLANIGTIDPLPKLSRCQMFVLEESKRRADGAGCNTAFLQLPHRLVGRSAARPACNGSLDFVLAAAAAGERRQACVGGKVRATDGLGERAPLRVVDSLMKIQALSPRHGKQLLGT